jgi:hypothetical protein
MDKRALGILGFLNPAILAPYREQPNRQQSSSTRTSAPLAECGVARSSDMNAKPTHAPQRPCGGGNIMIKKGSSSAQDRRAMREPARYRSSTNVVR